MQTYARVGEPFSSTRTRWRLGSKRRFVATIECDRWFPKDGFLPQITQTLLIAGGIVAGAGALLSRARPEAGEEIGHLERRTGGFGGLVDPGLRLVDIVDRQYTE